MGLRENTLEVLPVSSGFAHNVSRPAALLSSLWWPVSPPCPAQQGSIRDHAWYGVWQGEAGPWKGFKAGCDP